MIAETFAALYAGHQVGDHLAQTDKMAALKAGKGWPAAYAMAGHIATYLTCQAVAVAALTLVGVPASIPAATAALAVSGATHAFIDRRWPVRWLLTHTGSRDFATLAGHGLNGMYMADQALHVGCLFAAALTAAAVTA